MVGSERTATLQNKNHVHRTPHAAARNKEISRLNSRCHFGFLSLSTNRAFELFLLMGYSRGACTNPARRLFGATEMDWIGSPGRFPRSQRRMRRNLCSDSARRKP
jgi:hypothetical protein